MFRTAEFYFSPQTTIDLYARTHTNFPNKIFRKVIKNTKMSLSCLGLRSSRLTRKFAVSLVHFFGSYFKVLFCNQFASLQQERHTILVYFEVEEYDAAVQTSSFLLRYFFSLYKLHSHMSKICSPTSAIRQRVFVYKMSFNITTFAGEWIQKQTTVTNLYIQSKNRLVKLINSVK